MSLIRRIASVIWNIDAREFVGLSLMIMGLGRIGLYQARPIADLLPQVAYGWLLATAGIGLLVTSYWRCRWFGRLAAGCAAAILIGILIDADVVNVTTLIEAAMAWVCIRETWSRHYEC